MLVGIYVPTSGCWEITGEHKGEKLKVSLFGSSQSTGATINSLSYLFALLYRITALDGSLIG